MPNIEPNILNNLKALEVRRFYQTQCSTKSGITFPYSVFNLEVISGIPAVDSITVKRPRVVHIHEIGKILLHDQDFKITVNDEENDTFRT